MDTELQTGLIAAVLMAIPVLFGVFVFYARPTLQAATADLKERLGATQWARFEQYGRLAVQAAEQTLGAESNEAKKAFVVAFLKKHADTLGIAITEKELDTLIEAIVYEVKKQWNMSELTIDLPEIDAVIEPA